MKAKTLIRLAILIAVLGVVGGASFYTQQVRVAKTASVELKKADDAEEEGNFTRAEELYRLHLKVFPDDVDVQLKYANAILKGDGSLKRNEQAFQIYQNVLRRSPSRDDVRRRLMELKIDSKHFVSRGPQDEGADADLKILLGRKDRERDGDLWFWSGRCQEEGNNPKEAVSSYQKAIEYKATKRIEAYERCASLLRDKLDQPAEADRLIKSMVEDDRENYQVYLERGRYRFSQAAKIKDPSLRQSLLSDAKSDFQEARKRAEGKDEPYLELAKLAQSESRIDEAKQILEEGLSAIPTSELLYEQLANLLLRDHKHKEAIETLERGLTKLKSTTEQTRLRYILAELLVLQENTGELLLQIKEFDKAGFPPILVQYFTACYHMNSHDFVQARQLLTAIQPAVNRNPNLVWLKVRINLLLARCYGRLGEPEKQRDANLRAYSADPQNLAAHLDWIGDMINQGDTEGAIKEYRTIVDQAPQVRLRLAQLLIARNKRLPESQRDWSEVERLINDAQKAAPESPEPVALQAEYLVAQGKPALARQELEKARARLPKSMELWIAQANLLGFQGQVNEALKLLDQAKGELGDQVDVRLARARLWTMKKGPEVARALQDLARNLEVFPKQEDRHKLLNGLAIELIRQQDYEEASRLWSQLADQKPKDMEVRLNLLDLAFQLARTDDTETFIRRKAEIEKYIRQIEEIEGSDGSMGRYCQARYLIWQADQRATDANSREALRTKARVILNDLLSRRADWALIPLALAQIEEQELAEQSSLKDEEKQAKEQRIVGLYLQAVGLGHRPAPILRRTVGLLIKNHRGREALELLNSIPVESQFAGDLGRQASQYALEKGDYEGAEQIARKAVEAHPGEFSDRLWLVWILLASGHQTTAETELRKAVDLSKSDPDRWVSLVNFMVVTKQHKNAEDAVREAKANLPPAEAPLALAQCCEIMGKAVLPDEEAAKKWYQEAKEWYQKAEAAKPGDLLIKRRLTEFFLRTKQIDDAENQLKLILEQGSGVQAAETKGWARRTLALVLAFGTDPQRLRKALAYFELNNQPAAIGREGKALEDPEDLRVLAQVLELQKNPLQRTRAIEILEWLADKNLATAEDRFRLAQLCEQSGDWPRAREKYRDLSLRTRVLPSMETLKRRPYYLAVFAESLLRHRQSGDEPTLAEVQELVNEIRQLQPNALGTVVIELKLYQARNQLDKAAELIRTVPKPTPQVVEALAAEAEKLGLLELAKELYARRAEMPDVLQGKIRQAAFLGRRGDTKHALEILEPLWANTRDINQVAYICIDVLFGANSTHSSDREQLKRVGQWFERALAQPQNDPATTTLLLIGLGNIREQLGDYDSAKDLYERAIKKGDRDGVSYNNLAWLTALKDNKPKKALEYINNAIALKPSQPDFLDTRGIIHLSVGDIPSAINDLTKAVAIDPSPSKLFHLAQAYLASKNKEKAKEYLATARTKGFTSRDLHALEQPVYEKMLAELGAP
jgi:tetratricopeptide (TPR) repeat protein